MSSLFKSKGKKSKAGDALGLGAGPAGQKTNGKGGTKAGTFPLAAAAKPSGLAGSSSSPDVRGLGLDDFGRPRGVSSSNAPPAFAARPSFDRRVTSSTAGKAAQGGKGGGGGGGDEVQLVYGYTGIFTELELGFGEAEVAIKTVAEEIKKRALECPMLFSTRALDITMDGTHALIRSFVRDRREWFKDVQVATPHNLAAFLKWALARLVDPSGARGILPWQKYKNWRDGEKERGYPTRYVTTHLLYHLPSQTASLLSLLFELFSSAAAYSSKNGMTVHKIASLFGAFVFGLPDDQPFDYTYNSWLQYSNALEHLILAFIRDQKATSTTGQLPSRLELYIASYPNNIPSGAKPIKTARLVTLPRIRRYARFWSKNLVGSAASWKVDRCAVWDRIQSPLSLSLSPNPPRTAPPFGTPEPEKKVREGPTFTKGYKHLLNIRKGFEQQGAEEGAEEEDEEGDAETQRFRSLVEKEWSGFTTKGFDAPPQKQLEFDLTESERTRRKLKHDTLDWSSFVGKGFVGRETFLPTDLEFSKSLETTIVAWPEEKKELARKLHKTNKALPRFPYDIEPMEEAPVAVDDNFFEAWADALVASGWARDEVKESSWALVQYKARPVGHPSAPQSLSPRLVEGGDPRTDEVWILVEEVVPAEYRVELEGRAAKKGKKKAAFLRTRKTSAGSGTKDKSGQQQQQSKKVGGGAGGKKQKPPTTAPAAPLRSPMIRHPGDDVFDLRPGQTKSLTLTDQRTAPIPDPSTTTTRHSVAATMPAPSVAGAVEDDAPPSTTPTTTPVPPATDVFPSPSPTSPPSGPGGGHHHHRFMADFRAKARARQAGYRIGAGAVAEQAFEYTERPRKERDSLLRRSPRPPDAAGDDDGETKRGREASGGDKLGLPPSSSSDTWLDVQVRGNSQTRYAREAYTPSPPRSTTTATTDSRRVYDRPANPSPPDEDGDDLTAKIGDGAGRVRDSTASESPYGGYLDSELEDAPDVTKGEGEKRALPKRDASLNAVTNANAPPVKSPDPAVTTSPNPSSPRPDATPGSVERPPRTSSRPDNQASAAEPSASPATSTRKTFTPSPEAVRAANPFVSKAAKVSSIVDMFEGGAKRTGSSPKVGS